MYIEGVLEECGEDSKMLPTLRGCRMPLDQPILMDLRKVVRTQRIVWAVMLFSLFVYAVVLKIIRKPSILPPDLSLQYGLAGVGVVTAVVALYLRFICIARLGNTDEPVEDAVYARRIWAYHIVADVLSETTAMLGFCLAFMNGDYRLYGPLYLEVRSSCCFASRSLLPALKSAAGRFGL